MWIETATIADATRRARLLCDECGAIFAAPPAEDRRASWHMATIAGWARTARSPERHICADC